MTITSVSVVMTVVVLNFHYCGPTMKEVPEFMRSLLKLRYGGLTYTKHGPTRSSSTNPTLSSNTPYYENCPLGYPRDPHRSDNTRLTIDNIHEEMKDTSEFSSSESIAKKLNLSDYTNMNHKRSCTRKDKLVQEEILWTLRHLISKQEQEESHSRIIHEWRLIAQMIDAVLFWFFLVGTVTSSLTLLVILPLYSRQSYT